MVSLPLPPLLSHETAHPCETDAPQGGSVDLSHEPWTLADFWILVSIDSHRFRGGGITGAPKGGSVDLSHEPWTLADFQILRFVDFNGFRVGGIIIYKTSL